MLWAPPPMTSTEPPGRCSSCGTTVRQASARLSPAAATRTGSTPSGTGTSMWSAYGTRISSAIMPPHGPLAGPNPYAASSPTRVVEHLAVMPWRHSVQEPHETAHGTTTVCPMARSRDVVALGDHLADALVADAERTPERDRPQDGRRPPGRSGRASGRAAGRGTPAGGSAACHRRSARPRTVARERPAGRSASAPPSLPLQSAPSDELQLPHRTCLPSAGPSQHRHSAVIGRSRGVRRGRDRCPAPAGTAVPGVRPGAVPRSPRSRSWR